VVPLFNEEGNVEAVFARLQQLEEKLAPTKLEIIFVDDCSQDKTATLVRDLCRHHDNVRFIRFARNSGSHAAIMAGVAASRGDCAMFIAGDLQDPPEVIPEMLDRWRQGYSIVWAARAQVLGRKQQESLFSMLYWWMVLFLTNLPIPKLGIDFFLIDRMVVEALKPRHHCAMPYFMLVAETGFKSTLVFYTKSSRAAGKSGWTLKKKLTLVLETLLAAPKALRILSLAGMALAAAGALALAAILIARLALSVTSDSALLVIGALSFLTGLQMTMLGLVGEFVMLSLKEARRAPRYVVAERANFPADEPEPARLSAAAHQVTSPAQKTVARL